MPDAAKGTPAVAKNLEGASAPSPTELPPYPRSLPREPLASSPNPGGPFEPTGDGTLIPILLTPEMSSGEQIKRVLREARPRIEDIPKKAMAHLRSCFDNRLKSDPKLRGKIITEVVFSRHGRVTSAKVVESSIDDGEIVACVVAAFRRVRIPPRQAAVTVQIPLSIIPAD